MEIEVVENKLVKAFLHLLPKGYFWQWEERPMWLGFAKGLLRYFAQYIVKLQELQDGFFLKNNSLLADYSQLYNLDFESSDEARDLIYSGLHFSRIYLNEIVQKYNGVLVEGEKMKCTSTCVTSLGWLKVNTYFEVTVPLGGTQLTEFVKLLKKGKTAFCVLIVNGRDVDGWEFADGL